MKFLTNEDGGSLVLNRVELDGIAEILKPLFMNNHQLRDGLLKAAMDDTDDNIPTNDWKTWSALLALTRVVAEDFE